MPEDLPWQDSATEPGAGRSAYLEMVEHCETHPQPSGAKDLVEMYSPSVLAEAAVTGGADEISEVLGEMIGLSGSGWQIRSLLLL